MYSDNCVEIKLKLDSVWWVYLLLCADGSKYCGITTDLVRRLAQHNGELGGGAKYTKNKRPVSLLGSYPCSSRSMAGKLEILVKKRPAKDKLKFLLQGGITPENN